MAYSERNAPTLLQRPTAGRPYLDLGDSKEYRALVADARSGEDGPETYDWDEGIAP